MCEHLLSRFFFDYFEACSLIDYLEESFLKLKQFCLGGDECATFAFAKKLYTIMFESYQDDEVINVNDSLFSKVFSSELGNSHSLIGFSSNCETVVQPDPVHPVSPITIKSVLCSYNLCI